MRKKATKKTAGKKRTPAMKATKARKRSRTNRAARKPAPPPLVLRHRGETELTLGFVDSLLELMASSGVKAGKAAKHLGIPEAQFNEWLGIGRSDRETGVRSPYAYLLDVIDAADSGIEIQAIRKVFLHSDWRAAAWFVERRFPEDWAGTAGRAGAKAGSRSDIPYSPPVHTQEEAVAVVFELAKLVLNGMEIDAVPVDPSLDEEANKAGNKGGLRTIVAELLAEHIRAGGKERPGLREEIEAYLGIRIVPQEEERGAGPEAGDDGKSATEIGPLPASTESGGEETGRA